VNAISYWSAEHRLGSFPSLASNWPSRCSALLFTFLLALCVQAFAQSTTNSPIRFQAVDVFVDSKDAALAAYQLEFTVASGNAKIVGIEGGEHPAFAEAPFYDPKAIQQERVILAGFSTRSARELPKGKTRVATIHLQISGSDELKLATKLETAASSDGRKIATEMSVKERGQNEQGIHK